MVRVLFSRGRINDTAMCTNSADCCHANLVMRNAGITHFGIGCRKVCHRETRRRIDRDALHLAAQIDRHARPQGETLRQVLAATHNQSIIGQGRHSFDPIVPGVYCRPQDQV